ncbi:MAG: transcription factor S [Candidatus Aenigmarchaeota archaeon]|nr:transcription factor S [Candidatus Aenigmarchaeota archaeon]
MKFCKTCGNILVVKDTLDGKKLFCRKCNEASNLDGIMTINFPQSQQKEVAIFDETSLEFPTTKVLCPKCDKEVEAYWALQQTRAADEPPTRFYRCKECNNVWREYS